MTNPGWWTELASSAGSLDLGDDDTPFTIRLADLGSSFAERSGELSEQQRAGLFGVLEDVMVNGSEYDGNAVATGFFEALLNEWDRGFDLKSVWHHVGPESRYYCRAWNEFNGIPSPDWM